MALSSAWIVAGLFAFVSLVSSARARIRQATRLGRFRRARAMSGRFRQDAVPNPRENQAQRWRLFGGR